MNSISSNHLKLIKILKFIENQDYEFLEFFLKVENIKSEIKSVYKVLFPQKKNKKMNIMIEDLCNDSSLTLKLKKIQTSLKEERKFFLILELLIKKSLNLEESAKILQVTRRTLNYDLIDIKEKLLKFNLKIDSQIGKGIFLYGNEIDIRKASFHYFYKFLIEVKFLPRLFIDKFSDFFYNFDDYLVLNMFIDKLIKQCKVDVFFNTRELLHSFYLSFKCENLQSDLDVDQSYFSEIFKEKELENFFEILKNTILKNIDYAGILFLIELLKVLTGKISERIFSKKNDFLIWENFFLENFSEIPDYENIKVLKALILRISFIDKYFPIYSSEISLLNLNFEKSSFYKIISLFQWLKKYYKNLLFSDVILLFLLLKNFEVQKKEITLIYRDIPISLIRSLKKKIEIEHNIEIIDIIHINNLDILKKKIEFAGIICDIDLSNYDFKVLKLRI